MTLIVNLYGGPGTGKSTVSAGVFSKLKEAGINCELVQEFAKDFSWIKDYDTIKNQCFVTVTQAHRQYMLNGKVDVIVTDSPIVLGSIYQGYGSGPLFDAWLLDLFNQQDNLNLFLIRNLDKHAFNPEGRRHTLEQVLEKDTEILKYLEDNKIPFGMIKMPSIEDAVSQAFRATMMCITRADGENPPFII